MASPTLEIIIKSPNDKIPCQNISCPREWNVKKLKEHLCECYPTNPPPSTQRLIHAGKLLKDETILDSICRESLEPQTIHLVCRNSKITQPKPSVPETSNQSSTTDTSSNLTPEEIEEYQRGYYQYLQQFYLQNSQTVNSTTSSPHPMFNFSSQYPWMSAPFAGAPNPWCNYMAPPVSQADTELPPQNGDNVPAVGPDGNQWFRGARALLADLGVVNADGMAAAAEAPAAGNQQIGQQQQQAMMVGNPMGGGFMGAEEMGENGGNLDIVDRFYMLFRLCLFIGLCFAYSSLDKAIIVFSVAAYVYFYNIYRRHAAVRQAAQQAAPPPADEQRQPPQNQPNATDVSPEQEIRQRSLETAGSNVSAEPGQPAPVDEEPPRLTRLTNTVRLVANTSYQFVSSLIASLIPEQPPPIRLD